MRRGRELCGFSVLLGLAGLGVLGEPGGDGLLGHLQTDAVSAGLDDNGAFLHGADGAGDAADGQHVVAHGQGAAQVVRFLLPLVLGADHEEIEHGEHEYDENDALQSDSLQMFGLSASQQTHFLYYSGSNTD